MGTLFEIGKNVTKTSYHQKKQDTTIPSNTLEYIGKDTLSFAEVIAVIFT